MRYVGRRRRNVLALAIFLTVMVQTAGSFSFLPDLLKNRCNVFIGNVLRLFY